MEAAQRGDAAAYEALLRDCVPHIRRVARALGTPDDYIDDVTQETLFTIDRARHAFQPGRSFTAWLNAIARRRAIDVLRARGRHAKREIYEPAAFESYVDVAGLERTAAAHLAADQVKLLRDAIAGLTPSQREAVEAIGLRDQSLGETAAETGKTKGALKVNFHRALKSLRDRLQGDA
jgi:RNA polymerase sigma factor (sigma-70 family)